MNWQGSNTKVLLILGKVSQTASVTHQNPISDHLHTKACGGVSQWTTVVYCESWGNFVIFSVFRTVSQKISFQYLRVAQNYESRSLNSAENKTASFFEIKSAVSKLSVGVSVSGFFHVFLFFNIPPQTSEVKAGAAVMMVSVYKYSRGRS
jgi:hypothetical protein